MQTNGRIRLEIRINMAITIDGTTFNVSIISLEDSMEPLDKYAERNTLGKLKREMIGMFPKQTITFAAPKNATERAAYQLLWTKLTEASEFHTVVVADRDGDDFTYTGYFSGLKRVLRKWTATQVYWHSTTVNITAQEARYTP